MAFEIIASINTAGSIKEISNKLSNEVANGVNSKMPLKIVATIDTQKTINQINNSLNSISGISIKNINIDGNAITGAKEQLKTIVTNDTIENISKLTSNIQSLSSSFANLTKSDRKSFEAVMNGSFINASETIKILEDRFKNFGATAKGIYDNSGQLDRITVSMKNSENEARTLTFVMKELDNGVKKFFFDSANYNDKGIEQQLSKAETKAISLTSSLEKLKSKYTDINTVKPITNEDNKLTLSNKYEEVITSINKIRTANSSNMSIMEADVKKLISEYERLAVSLQNMEYMATSLRTKDVGTIQKVAIEDLKAFENQIKNSKVPIKEMKEDLKQLNETLSKPLNKEELTNYLNTFDIAKSKFKALTEQYKVSESESKKYYDRIKGNIREINKVQTQKLKATSPEEIKLLDEQLKRLKSRLSYNEKQISKKKLENDELQREIGNLKSQYEWEQNLLNVRIKNSNIKNQEQDLKKYSNSIDGIISKLNSTSQLSIFNTNSTNVSVIATRESITDLINRFENLKSTMGNIKTPEQFKDFQNKIESLNNEFIKVYGNAKNLQNQFRSDNSATALGTKIQTLRTQIEKYMNTNTKAMNNGYKNQFDELLNSLRNVSNANEFNKIKQKFQGLTAEVDRLGLRGMSVIDTLKQKLSKFASWMGITMVTASVAREIRGMYSTVIELDTALVDLNKTFQGTSADLEDFYYGANKVAKQLGSTTKEIIDSASSWSRLGYSSKESALQMAETSSIFASVSPDMDLEQATTSLTSILKAYKDYGITTENALDEVVSKINQIGNKFAVTNGNISTGLQKSASSMALAGVTFDKAVSLFTSAQEIVQDDDSVGK